MLNIFDLIAIPLGIIIKVIYDLIKNYGLTIIIFTVIIKLLVLPLTMKSQKAMKKQQKIQPVIMELQKKYANDKEKLQREMMKVYQENNVSMMGGCLPLLIQMPILIGLYRVIQAPLQHFLRVDINAQATLDKVADIVSKMTAQFPDVIRDLANQTPEILLRNYQIQLSTWSQMVNGPGDSWAINFNFLGLDLAEVPSAALTALMQGNFSEISVILLLLIPIIAILTTWLTMRQSQKMSGQTAQNNSNGDNPAQSMSKTMNILAPAMTGFFAFTLPSGLGIYWIVSNVLQLAQQQFLNSYFEKKEADFVVKIPEKRRKNGKKRK